MLADAGFENALRVEWTGYDTSDETRGATFRARRPDGTGSP
jgi:hypothetical protein